MKNGKSPGIDWIPVEFVKETIHIIQYNLKRLFKYILHHETYSDSWGEGLNVTIPKGNNDIRPIICKNSRNYFR